MVAEVYPQLFARLSYFLAGDPSVKSDLNKHGACEHNYLSDMVNYVICDPECDSDYIHVAKQLYEIPVVSHLWVSLSIRCGQLLPVELFTVQDNLLFRGMTFTMSNIDVDDSYVLWALLVTNGASVQSKLKHNVTHLISSSCEGQKFTKALELSNKINIVSPDWVTDSIKKGIRLPYKLYHPKRLLINKVPKIKIITQTQGSGDKENLCDINHNTSKQLDDITCSGNKGGVRTGVDNAITPTKRKVNSMSEIFEPIEETPIKLQITSILTSLDDDNMSGDNDQQDVATHSSSKVTDNKGLNGKLPFYKSSEKGPIRRRGRPPKAGGAAKVQVVKSLESASPEEKIVEQLLGDGSISGWRRVPVSQTRNSWPCSCCDRPIYLRHASYLCNWCDKWTHKACAHITHDGEYSTAWVCPTCVRSLAVNPPAVPNNTPRSRTAKVNITRLSLASGSNLTQKTMMPLNRPTGNTKAKPQLPPPPHTNTPHNKTKVQPTQKPMARSEQRKPSGIPQLPSSSNSKPTEKKPIQSQCVHNSNVSRQQSLLGEGDNSITRNISDNSTTAEQCASLDDIHNSPVERERNKSTLNAMQKLSLNKTSRGPTNSHQKEVSRLCSKSRDIRFVSVYRELLAGCVFYIEQYQNESNVEEWREMITSRGGSVSTEFTQSVTHLVCKNRQSAHFNEALLRGVKCVTAFWLHDVLRLNILCAPSHALHLPPPFTDTSKPATGEIISVTGFLNCLDGRDRLAEMIHQAGAKYTGHLTSDNTMLICRRPYGLKYDGALRLGIPIVNVRWLTDLLMGSDKPLMKREMGIYRDFNPADTEPFSLSPPLVCLLMDAWSEFIPVVGVVKPSQTSGSTNANISPPSQSRKVKDKLSVRVLFSQVHTELLVRLQRIVHSLGGEVCRSELEPCTHLVMASPKLTKKFFCGINSCTHLLKQEWLLHCERVGRFDGEADYQWQGADFNIPIKPPLTFDVESKLKAVRDEAPVLDGYTVYFTKSSESRGLRDVVTSCGGRLIEEEPSVESVLQRNKSGHPLIIISHVRDGNKHGKFMSRGIPVYTADLIYRAVFLHRLEFDCHRIIEID